MPGSSIEMTAKQQWFATRVLQDSADPTLELEVQLGFPEQAQGDYRCAFRVKGLNQGKTEYSGGVDALQALVNALEGIATQLRESGRSLTWLGGDPCLRRTVPVFLGPAFANAIEAHIDAQIASFIEAKKERP
jgi:hypothetical protein